MTRELCENRRVGSVALRIADRTVPLLVVLPRRCCLWCEKVPTAAVLFPGGRLESAASVKSPLDASLKALEGYEYEVRAQAIRGGNAAVVQPNRVREMLLVREHHGVPAPTLNVNTGDLDRTP